MQAAFVDSQGVRVVGRVKDVSPIEYEGDIVRYQLTIIDPVFDRGHDKPKRVVNKASSGLRDPKPYRDPYAITLKRIEEMREELTRRYL